MGEKPFDASSSFELLVTNQQRNTACVYHAAYDIHKISDKEVLVLLNFRPQLV